MLAEVGLKGESAPLAREAAAYLATEGVYWTLDAGKTWTRLPIPGTKYYPRTVQFSSGKILCIDHVGSDDVYGSVDPSIFQQTFRLKVDRRRN